jgi:hypothetical protein
MNIPSNSQHSDRKVGSSRNVKAFTQVQLKIVFSKQQLVLAVQTQKKFQDSNNRF